MYKVSIWLKGGGKIVEECDMPNEIATSIYYNIKNSCDNTNVHISRSPEDEYPIIVRADEIAAVQIDGITKSKSYYDIRSEKHRGGRRLETRF